MECTGAAVMLAQSPCDQLPRRSIQKRTKSTTLPPGSVPVSRGRRSAAVRCPSFPPEQDHGRARVDLAAFATGSAAGPLVRQGPPEPPITVEAGGRVERTVPTVPAPTLGPVEAGQREGLGRESYTAWNSHGSEWPPTGRFSI